MEEAEDSLDIQLKLEAAESVGTKGEGMRLYCPVERGVLGKRWGPAADGGGLEGGL